MVASMENLYDDKLQAC